MKIQKTLLWQMISKSQRSNIDWKKWSACGNVTHLC